MERKYGDEFRDPMTEAAAMREPPQYGADGHLEINDVEARQGGTGRPVLYVLVAALLLGAAYVMGSAFYANNAVDSQAGRVASTETSQPIPTPSINPPANTTPAPATTPAPNMTPAQ